MNTGEDRIIGGAFDRNKLLKFSKSPMICIYNCPDDYPDSIIARVWDMGRPTRLVAMADTLEEIRAMTKELIENNRQFLTDFTDH